MRPNLGPDPNRASERQFHASTSGGVVQAIDVACCAMSDVVSDASDTPTPRILESQLLEVALKMAAAAGEHSPTLIGP